MPLACLLLFVSAINANTIRLESISLHSIGEPIGFCKYGHYALLWGGEHHLSIIDLNIPGSYPIAVYDNPNIYSKSSALHIYNDHAYLNFVSSMDIINLEDIFQPRLEGSMDTEYKAIDFQGDFFYTMDAEGKLSIHTMNNPVSFEVIGVLDSGISNISYFEVGDGVAVCKADSLFIIDISQPTMPVMGARLDIVPSTDFCSRMAVNTHYLYNSNQDQLYIYDLEDPQNPYLVSTTTITSCQELFFSKYFHNNVMWSEFRYWQGNDWHMGILGMDISNPLAPYRKMWGANMGWTSMENYPIIHVSENLMSIHRYPYLGFSDISDRILEAFEIYFPEQSVSLIAASEQYIVGSNPELNLMSYKDNGSVSAIRFVESGLDAKDHLSIVDDLLFCAYPYKTYFPAYHSPALEVYDLKTTYMLGSIIIVEYDESPITMYDMKFHNKTVILSNGKAGLMGIGFDNPRYLSQRFLIYEYGKRFQGFCVEGDELWVGFTSGLWEDDCGISCYDISNIEQPILKYTAPIIATSATKIVKQGQYLYVLNGYNINSYRILENSLEALSQFILWDLDAHTLMPFGDGLLVGGNRGMMALSLENPITPEIVGEYYYAPLPHHPWEPAYVNTFYAELYGKILVSNGIDLKSFDASLARFLCEAGQSMDAGDVRIFPNPAKDLVKIGFVSQSTDPVSISLYNIRGQKLIDKTWDTVSRGINVQSLDLKSSTGTGLATGFYLYKLKSKSFRSAGKILIRP